MRRQEVQAADNTQRTPSDTRDDWFWTVWESAEVLILIQQGTELLIIRLVAVSSPQCSDRRQVFTQL